MFLTTLYLNFFKNYIIYISSLTYEDKTIYSVLIINIITDFCFHDIQIIILLIIKKIYFKNLFSN